MADDNTQAASAQSGQPERGSWFSGLKRVHMLFARMVADIERVLPRSQLKATERRVLLALRMGDGPTDAQLARYLGVDRSHLSRTLKGLISNGLVTHRPNPKHVSQRRLSLTDTGQGYAKEADAIWTDALESQFNALPPKEQRLVLNVMGGIGDPDEMSREFRIEFAPIGPRDLSWILDYSAGNAGRDLSRMLDPARKIAEFLKQEAYACYGSAAHHANKTVGCCLLLPLRDNELHASAHLFVHGAYNKRGVEKQLLTMCIDHAREVELLGIHFIAPEDDTELYDVLRNLGFKRRREKMELNEGRKLRNYRRYERREPFD